MEEKGEVLACAVEWQEKLRNCQYAGEVYLDQERLVQLARNFARFLTPGDVLCETALLVLAVNCAYHYYDDEGFWPHFCRLLGIECTSANQDRIGRAIERRLDLLGLKRTTRAGPFRYVGAVLEQCGVSKRYIAAFAGIVKELKKDFRSWDALLMMGEQDFRKRLGTVNCSRYLKDFLLDTAGWRFTLQVCELLMLYEQGGLTIADLKELPGYQPDFWDEFIIHFHQKRQTDQRAVLALCPRLLFLPENRCLAIRFPGRDYADGVRHPAIPGFWQFPVTLINRTDAWSEYYAGSIPASEGQPTEWILPGWLPDELPALFDLKYGFLRRGSRVKPGEYYLLLPDGVYPPCEVISELGPVYVPGNINYRAYRVLVEPGTLIHGYESVQDSRTDISLAWVEPEKFRLWCADPSVDVFAGSLPAIAVSDFRPIEERRAAMFFSTGPVSGRVRNPDDLEWALKEINKNAPVAGRFFVLAIGRTGRPGVASALSELEFYLLPRLDIRFSRRLYAFNEQPVIEIDQAFTGQLHLEDCYSLDPGGKKWVVPLHIQCINGVVECRNVVAGIKIPVHRARLYSPEGNPVRYLIQTEPDMETVFLLTGCPDSEARLGLYRIPAGHVPVRFDADGLARLSWEDILKLVTNCGYSITEMVLTAGEYTASTGAVVIDFPSVSTGICAGAGYQACVCTAQNLTRVLDVCTQICQGVPSGRRYNLSRLLRFHPVLDEWIFSIFACAAVFDGVDVLVGGQKVDWIEKISSEDLRLVLGFVNECQMGRWTGERPPDRKEALPPVERWRNALDQFLLPYIAEGGIPGLSEWAGEIRRHQTSFRSGIGRLAGGHSLSAAWVCYHRGLFESALSLLNNVGESPPIVTELCDFLRILLLLRMARTGAARKAADSKRRGGSLQPALSLLQYVLQTLDGEETVPARQIPLDSLADLPLRTEDRVLLEAASENRNNPLGADQGSVESEDWLLLWFLASSASSPQRKSELARKLLRVKDRIPASPEKTAILQRVIRFTEVR